MTTIDGDAQEVTEELANPPAKASDSPHQVVSFNPLDAEPVAFKRQLDSRSENYDALANHLRGILVAGKDFGRIHFAKKGTEWDQCEKPWACSYEQEPTHWSKYRLFAPGADKVLGLLGLGVTYPDEQDYRRATLKGLYIEDVIIKAFIDNGRGQVICEGMGAAGRKQHKNDLNNTLKKACKRARLDAVMRLPAISALFEDDFLAQVAQEENSLNKRQRQVNPKYDTGSHLEVWPLKGKGMEGERFDSFDNDRIAWIMREFQDKPDIFNAAKRVHDARDGATAAPSHTPPPSTADGPAKDSEGDRQQGSDAGGAGPVTSAYDDYPEAQ